ncbi:Fusaric acid resistance protein-like [Roseomonas rosea]|uniref:Fusaric acid resistance protein-like n=1 Tax=Muricoccus roseus TaxID=198092 RepID=A0A1M6PUA3_9PROT|nr:FUSC family protein [Roseomonas rosea]SHK11515.1 Fusaric acid resistance protein-like [Roseomonas rosea]
MAALPRPSRSDDPFFSLRCAIGVTAGLALIEPLALNPGMILPSMLVSLFCGQRGPYRPVSSIMTAAILAVLIWTIFGLCVLTQGMPAVQFVALLAVCYGALYLLLRTGNQLGVMVLVFTSMIGVLFGNSRAGAEAMRDAFTVTAVVSALLIPLLNLLLPPRRDAAPIPPPPPPALERPGLHALLRLAVLAPVLLAFLAGAPVSGLIFMIIVALVLGYPTRDAQRTQGRERILSTVQGGLVGIVVLVLFTLQAQFPVLLLLVLLAALWFTERMVAGPRSANTYQLGLSVLAVIVSGATLGTHPLETATTRLLLTIGGAAFGLAALSLLEWAFAPAGRACSGTGQDTPTPQPSASASASAMPRPSG